MIFRSQKLNKILFEIIKAKGMINRWSCFHLLQSSFRRRSYMAAAPPPSTAIPSLRKSPCIDTLSAGKTVGLRLRGCSASENEKRSGFVKARAVGPHLLAEEIRFRLEGTTLDGTGRYRTGQGGYLGFPEDSHLGPKKIMVAVDVDEVLGNFVSALNRFIVDCYASNHSVSEYHVYEFFKIWNCSRGEADKRVHEFFKTPYFESGIHPIPGAQQVLQKLSRFCDLSIVTSRQNVIKDHTIKWIEKHFPGLFQEIHFGNHFALDGTSRPKSDICRSLGAKVLIDDNPRYAIECAEVGIRVLLFDYENSYPWSKTEATQQHPLVTKVHNWEEVEHHLVSWTNS